MNKKDQWSVHLEYLKVAVTLATGILALAAVMYSDASKMPTDWSKYILLVCAGFVFLTLLASLLAIIDLANWVVADETGMTDELKKKKKSNITWWAGASHLCLVLVGFLLFSFFFSRTVFPPASASQAIEVAQGLVDNRIDRAKETASLQSLDVVGDKYNLVFQVLPGTRTFTLVLKSQDNSLLSIIAKN